jgi:hypothetical protein
MRGPEWWGYDYQIMRVIRRAEANKLETSRSAASRCNQFVAYFPANTCPNAFASITPIASPPTPTLNTLCQSWVAKYPT